jgi:pyrimidine-nucleoside phosphorylase
MDQHEMRRAIERKREGERLDERTWHAMIESYMAGEIDDAQMAAFAMACVWRGLDLDEAAALTGAMVASGATLRYPGDRIVVDKHSSGGVSDIVSLVVVPLVAACGVPVAKLSGRALGHTGGTIDKLEALDGIRLTPTMEAFVAQVERVGCAIAAQSEAIVPADKRLYHLRDRTGTVPAIGLIASSIVSKKIAGGAAAFVFDVKCGNAAFMHDVERATDLARVLVAIAERFGRRARAVVSDMNEPLGRCIGSGLELIEARDVLRTARADDRTIGGCLSVATEMLELAGIADARPRAEAALRDGSAYAKFVEMIEAQGSSRAALEALRPSAAGASAVAARSGFVTRIDARGLGEAARALWERDRTAGIMVDVRVGDTVESGAALASIFGEGVESARVAACFEIGDEAPPARPLIHAVIESAVG